MAITQVDVSDLAEIVDMCQTLGASLLVMDVQCLREPTVAAQLVGSGADIVTERVEATR